MDSPIAGPAAKLGGLLNQNNWRIRLVEEDQIETKRNKAHD